MSVINSGNCVVTGVTGNLGSAVARTAALYGYHVFGCARHEKDIGLSFIDHTFTECDLGSSFHTRKLAEHWNIDKLHMLVHCAGYQQFMRHDHTPRGDVSSMLINHLSTAFDLAYAFRDALRKAEDALVVFISSIQATAPREGRLVYGAAKAGVEGLTRGLAVELAPDNVRVLCLRLGHLKGHMAGVTVDERETRRAPLGLIPTDEVAQLVLSLYHARHLTGAVIDYDAGHQLNIWADKE